MSDQAASFDAARQAADLLNHRYDQQAGLAWTPLAGTLLPVQVVARPGTGAVTAGDPGLLGATQAGVSWVRANAARLAPELSPQWFEAHDIRVFQPWGPSPVAAPPEEWAGAGAPIAAAVVSLVSGRMVRNDVAITGGLAPDGSVVSVGDFPGKVGAAGKGWMKRVIAPSDNQAELAAVPDRIRSGIEVVFVATVGEALQQALAKHRIKGYSLEGDAAGGNASVESGPASATPGQARAVVVSASLEGMQKLHTWTNLGRGPWYELVLRVHRPDGSTADIATQVTGKGASELSFQAGDIVPVRLDPADLSKATVDEDALRAARQQSASAIDETRVRAAEDSLRSDGW